MTPYLYRARVITIATWPFTFCQCITPLILTDGLMQAVLMLLFEKIVTQERFKHL